MSMTNAEPFPAAKLEGGVPQVITDSSKPNKEGFQTDAFNTPVFAM
jgi:hypothetical protein